MAAQHLGARLRHRRHVDRHAHHFAFVRVAVVYVAVIWLVSLVRRGCSHVRRSSARAHWLRLGVNYISRNFYQQVLFFVLPIYYASATPARST